MAEPDPAVYGKMSDRMEIFDKIHQLAMIIDHLGECANQAVDLADKTDEEHVAVVAIAHAVEHYAELPDMLNNLDKLLKQAQGCVQLTLKYSQITATATAAWSSGDKEGVEKATSEILALAVDEFLSNTFSASEKT